MNDDRALALIRAVNRVAGFIGWCSLWLFIIALNTCK